MAGISEEKKVMLDFISIMMGGNAKKSNINEFRVQYVKVRIKSSRFKKDTKVNTDSEVYEPKERNEIKLITDEKCPLIMSNPNVNLEEVNNSDENSRFKAAYEIIKETNQYIESYLQKRDCQNYFLSVNVHDLKECVDCSKEYILDKYGNEIEEGILLEDNAKRNALKLSSDLTLRQFKEIFPLLSLIKKDYGEKVGEFEDIVRGENEKKIEAMEANYSKLTDENQARLSENIDKIIANHHDEIFKDYKALLYEYNENGTKKSFKELEEKRHETIDNIDINTKNGSPTNIQEKAQVNVYYIDLYSKMVNKMIVDKESSEKIAEVVNTINGMKNTIDENSTALKNLIENVESTKNQPTKKQDNKEQENERKLIKKHLRKIEQVLKQIEKAQNNQELVKKKANKYTEIENRQRNNEQDREPKKDHGVPYESSYDVEEEPVDKAKREKETKEVDKEPQEESNPEKELPEKSTDKEKKAKKIDKASQEKNELEKELQNEKDKEQDNFKDKIQTKELNDDNYTIPQDTNEIKNIENDNKDININVNINTHSTVDFNNTEKEENEPNTTNVQEEEKQGYTIESDGVIFKNGFKRKNAPSEDIPHFEPPKEVDDSKEKADYVELIKEEIMNNEELAIKLVQKYKEKRIIEIRNMYKKGQITKKTFDEEIYDLISSSISHTRYLKEAYKTLIKMDEKELREILGINVENREKLAKENQYKQEKVENIEKDEYVVENLKKTEKRMEREKETEIKKEKENDIIYPKM